MYKVLHMVTFMQRSIYSILCSENKTDKYKSISENNLLFTKVILYIFFQRLLIILLLKL